MLVTASQCLGSLHSAPGGVLQELQTQHHTMSDVTGFARGQVRLTGTSSGASGTMHGYRCITAAGACGSGAGDLWPNLSALDFWVRCLLFFCRCQVRFTWECGIFGCHTESWPASWGIPQNFNGQGRWLVSPKARDGSPAPAHGRRQAS